jgi:uncharacterized cysteine cluster protein YcgN (CxxCxxCC family)
MMWIKRAWQHISPEMTAKGCRKCCICNAMDGTDEDMLWNVRSECEEDEGTDCEDGDSDSNW